VKGGDTFKLVGVADRHTWVVLTDPDQDTDQILIVSFTSFTPGIGMDASCVVETNEYSILTNRSCIYYEDIKELSLRSNRCQFNFPREPRATGGGGSSRSRNP
jgi:hypothetical protein